MPFLKRKPFPLAEPPEDLEPRELVFQVRFTKEIFRDYQYPFSVLFESCWFLLFDFFLSAVMSLSCTSLCAVAEESNRK